MFILPFTWLGISNDAGYVYLNHLALILVVHHVPQSNDARPFDAGPLVC
jgi:hypothetical protein